MPRDYVSIATQYARDVVKGKIPVCLYVRQACQRQLDDLARKKWGYSFDKKRACLPCEFIELLPHVEGKQWAGQDIHLEPWQVFILTTVFGWVDSNGNRRFRKVYEEVPRKNAKTTVLSGIGLYCLCADGETGAGVFSAASKAAQAKISLDVARRMVKKKPQLREHLGLTVYEHSIFRTADGSHFRALSKDNAGSKDGLNISCGLIDEVHAHTSRDTLSSVDTATGARAQPLIWEITTAGSNRSGICYEERAYALKVLSGAVDDDSVFGIVYTIDQDMEEIIGSVDALEVMYDVCQCESVNAESYARSWVTICAQHVITDGGGDMERLDALSTRIDKLGLAECVRVAITNGSTKTLRKQRQEPMPEQGIGQNAIQRKGKSHITNGDLSLKINERFSINIVLRNTESQEKSTTCYLLSRMEDARFAGDREKVFAWITAITQELFVESCADDAIRQLVFSEILNSTYHAHSHTCKVKDYCLNQNALIRKVKGDSWFDESSWRKANPNYGVSVNPEDLRRKAKAAQESASKQNEFLTKHLNVWVNASTAWMNMGKWDACANPSLSIEDFVGQPCWIALDLASKLDITAKAMLFLREGRYYLFCKSYLPESVIESGSNDSYTGWASDGWITVTDGNTVDLPRIGEEVKDDASRFAVQSVLYDPWNATELSTRLLADGAPMVECRMTTQNLSEAMKLLEAAVIEGNLEHDGNPLLSWCMSNVVVKEDNNGNVFPKKEFPELKIDCAVASIMAFAGAVKAEQTGPAWLETNGVVYI